MALLPERTSEFRAKGLTEDLRGDPKPGETWRPDPAKPVREHFLLRSPFQCD